MENKVTDGSVMEVLDKNTLEGVLRTLNSGIKGRKLYPAGHPAITAPFKKCYEQISMLLKIENPILLGRVEDVLVFGHHSFIDHSFTEILEVFKEKGLEGISFQKGVTLKEFIAFIEMLYSDRKYEVDELRRGLLKNSILHITIKSLPIGNKYLEVHQKAVEVVKGNMEAVRLGALPKTEVVMEIINNVTDLVLEDKNAMIGLTMIKDYDNYLFTHSVNVTILTIAMGDALGIERPELHRIGIASLLHDIGKTGIGENIIKKPGSLNDEEWEKIKEHPLLGFRIVEKMKGIAEITSRMVLEHHIRYDMTGYPNVKKWDKPHPYSMIITIADTYDAVTTLRAYQRPMGPAQAISRMQSMAGSVLDPNLLKVFTNMLGIYPVGTLVRLNTNEVGIIIKGNPEDNSKPVVRIVFDREGRKLRKTFLLDLSKPPSQGETIPSIVASVDPLTKNIKVEDCFKEASNL